MKWADFTLWCHHRCSNYYLGRASDCIWHKEKAKRNNGSILLIKMSSLCQNQRKGMKLCGQHQNKQTNFPIKKLIGFEKNTLP